MRRPLTLFFTIISLAALAIFAVLTLSYGNHFDWLASKSFWTVWLMTVIPVCVSTAITVFFLIRFGSSETFTVAPLIICSATFEAVSYGIGIRLITIISTFFGEVPWYTWTHELIAIIVYAVVLFYFIFATNYIIDHRNHIKNKVNYIKSMVYQLNAAIPLIQDEKLKNAISDLRDDIKYSDPISNENVAYIEEVLSSTVTDIIQRANQGADLEACSLQIQKAKSLILQRNAEVKANK